MSELRDQLIAGYRSKAARLRAQGRDSEADAWLELCRKYAHASGAGK